MNMTWIKSVSLKDIHGPTLYTAIASALVMVVTHGLGWHLSSTTVLGFFGIVGSFIWNNGKFGFKAVHTANFWITALAGLGLVLQQGLGLHIPNQYLIGGIVFVIGTIFHTANATQAVQKAVAAVDAVAAKQTTPTKGA